MVLHKSWKGSPENQTHDNSQLLGMKIDCPDKICSLEYRVLPTCVMYEPNEKTNCDIPFCNLTQSFFKQRTYISNRIFPSHVYLEGGNFNRLHNMQYMNPCNLQDILASLSADAARIMGFDRILYKYVLKDNYYLLIYWYIRKPACFLHVIYSGMRQTHGRKDF